MGISVISVPSLRGGLSADPTQGDMGTLDAATGGFAALFASFEGQSPVGIETEFSLDQVPDSSSIALLPVSVLAAGGVPDFSPAAGLPPKTDGQTEFVADSEQGAYSPVDAGFLSLLQRSVAVGDASQDLKPGAATVERGSEEAEASGEGAWYRLGKGDSSTVIALDSQEFAAERLENDAATADVAVRVGAIGNSISPDTTLPLVSGHEARLRERQLDNRRSQDEEEPEQSDLPGYLPVLSPPIHVAGSSAVDGSAVTSASVQDMDVARGVEKKLSWSDGKTNTGGGDGKNLRSTSENTRIFETLPFSSENGARSVDADSGRNTQIGNTQPSFFSAVPANVAASEGAAQGGQSARQSALGTDTSSQLAGTQAMFSSNGLIPEAKDSQEQKIHIDTTLSHPRWGEALGERVVWMVKNENQSAQITLNPPQLGPVQVNLTIDGNQASAAFASPHAEVRQLIEDAMPRLREMFADSGINLNGSSVGSQLSQQQSQDMRDSGQRARFAGETAILPGDTGSAGKQAALPLRAGRGMVDLFA